MTLPGHVKRAAIVINDARLVYVPIPKAGSTAVLWALLDLVELEPGNFTRSSKLETTRALTIHDQSIWGRAHRLEGRSGRPRREVLDADDWLAFTVVRDPVRRLWSAWVSKLLLRDPRFVAMYGAEPWFPTPPRSANDVLDGFRAFVEVLDERPTEWHDPHWSSQSELAGMRALRYDLVAQVERLPGDLEPVNQHLAGVGLGLLRLRRENSSLVPFTSLALDAETWDRCAAFTATDRDVLGYEMPELGGADRDREWSATVEARLPGIHAIIERNERIGDMKQLLKAKAS
jgi:hypothetical protein